MDEVLRKFRDDALTALGDNLVCLAHHGSRAKCEAHAESDYDFIIVLKKVNANLIKRVRNLLQSNSRFTAYLLSLSDIENLPKGHLLEFMHSKPLYGKIEASMPNKEEVRQYLSHSRRMELSSLRHWLILPQPQDRKARVAYYEFKFVYVYLSYLAFIETGKLPSTRKQTIAYFQNKKGYSHAIKLLRILDKWEKYRDKVAKNPNRYLFMLEKFFRDTSP